MIINNFDAMEDILKPESNDDFWFGQIIARRKDIPDLSRSDKWIKTYYLRDFNHLKSKEEEIIKLCEAFHARFYLNPNVRSFERVNAQMGQAAWTNIQNKQYDACVGCIDSICGGAKYPGKEKIWVIDVDNEDNLTDTFELGDLINHCMPNPGKIKALKTVKTLHGEHILTRPFNLKEFSEKLSTCENVYVTAEDIHKNSPTVIYFNEQHPI